MRSGARRLGLRSPGRSEALRGLLRPQATLTTAARAPRVPFIRFTPARADSGCRPSPQGVENLFRRMDRMVAAGPVFCDITWGAGGTTADVTLDIADRMQNQACVETMMHLTCTNMKAEMVTEALLHSRAKGVRNILALRGDPPKGQEKFEAVEGGFECALDLVRFIKKTHGSEFGICVAGYPEAHPDFIVDDPEEMEQNYWKNIAYLKEKVDAGAGLIITQLFYDCDIFLKFVKDCRQAGIQVPILPGIMPIQSYGGFKRMTAFCKTKIPQTILDTLEPISENEAAVKAYGIHLGAQMCRRLLDAGTPGLHMYSLNLEKSVLGILKAVGLVGSTRPDRPLPWRAPVNPARSSEAVRPVFWAARPRSYIARTAAWAELPSARWSGAEAFGPAEVPDLSKKLLAALGSPGDSAAAAAAVGKWWTGSADWFPWSEGSAPTTGTRTLSSAEAHSLWSLTRSGLLPVNFQPCVRGVPSSDVVEGWGASGGTVFRAAYLECFCPPELFDALRESLEGCGSLSFMAATAAGETVTCRAEGPCAVDFGVFPGAGLAQPTVFCPKSFQAWKPEAFSCFEAWAALCGEESEAAKVLRAMSKTYYLVSVVDHDLSGDVFTPFHTAVMK